MKTAILCKKFVSKVVSIRFLLQLVYKEVLIYVIVYFLINILYRFALSAEDQRTFAKVVAYFNLNLDFYGQDLTFLLGFYVSLAAKRWWDQYQSLPWPDKLAVCLTGLLTTEEMERLEVNTYKTTSGNSFASNWWLPLTWATDLIRKARQERLIHTDREIMRELSAFQNGLEQVENYANVSIPLVYEVVVNCAIYLYFVLSLVADQLVEEGTEDVFHPYVPIFKIFKLVLLLGWLKVAQSIEKPFGDDESDIDVYQLVKRHIW
eukprot:maker-scaffold224_size251237-snap-gene-0.19 protein:Tk05440 transcript:maker-scaffold224_size251237-snap-gene-0.19-mRNA-1 annotation:"bestrophin 2"